MSTKGSRRSAGISLTTTQRTAGMSAACYNELPQHEPSAADGIDVNQPLEAIGAAEAENSAHKKAPFRDFHNSPLPEASPARDDLSSLSYVSFSDEDIYKPRLLEQHFTEDQTFNLSSKQHMKHSWQMTSSARAFVPFAPRRFTKSSVGDEIAMSSDRERSVVMRC